uniref:Transmembrane protein 154 n=1 Tax=Astatotilapia calliptera TaxID=8154 RepID=A0AAX7VJ71_ASTCA
MSVSWIGNMSTPRVKVPLLLLLLLTTVLPGTGFGQEEMEQSGSGNDTVTTVATSIDENSMDETESSGLDPIIIIIPAVLVVLIICMIVCGIFINRRWNKQKRNPDLSKEDPYLDGSSTEKVPMPMFEEDVPSVLELEMEELDEWMKKDGETAEDSKCL